jgi:phosphoserine phosphatase RsbU/P
MKPKPQFNTAIINPLTPMPEADRRYRFLLDAARRIFQVENLDDLVRHVLGYSLEIMEAEACSLYLPDVANAELIIYSARGSADTHVHQARIPIDLGIAGRVYKNQESVNLTDVSRDEAFYDCFDKKSGFQTRSMFCLPLLDHQKCVGVLQALNPVGRPHFTEQDIRIIEGLGVIVASVLLRLERDQQAHAIARMQGELNAARDIQQSLLPPARMSLEGARIAVEYAPARFVSGDFYAVHPQSDGSLLVILGDVSGKGVPAALTAAQVTTEIQALAAQIMPLPLWVQVLNQRLCERLTAGRFVAATFLRYHPSTRGIEVVRAGQFAPWHHTEKGWAELVVPTHLPLGVNNTQEFTGVITQADPGQEWLLFSDGIIEGRNRDEEEFGWDRFRAALAAAPSRDTLAHLWSVWEKFLNRAPLHDDACLIALRTLPPSRREFTSEPRCCKQGRVFVEQWAITAGFSDETVGHIILAADEAFTNCIRHAYEGRPGEKIILQAELTAEELILQLRDFATFCDLNAIQARKLEEVRPGGLGLHYIRTIFDRVESKAETPGMLLTLAKRLPNTTQAGSMLDS